MLYGRGYGDPNGLGTIRHLGQSLRDSMSVMRNTESSWPVQCRKTQPPLSHLEFHAKLIFKLFDQQAPRNFATPIDVVVKKKKKNIREIGAGRCITQMPFRYKMHTVDSTNTVHYHAV